MIRVERNTLAERLKTARRKKNAALFVKREKRSPDAPVNVL